MSDAQSAAQDKNTVGPSTYKTRAVQALSGWIFYCVRLGIRDTMILDFRGEITKPKIDRACGPARLDCDHGAAKHRQKKLG